MGGVKEKWWGRGSGKEVEGLGIMEYWRDELSRLRCTPPTAKLHHSNPGFSMNTDGESFCFVSGWRMVRFKTKSNSSGL